MTAEQYWTDSDPVTYWAYRHKYQILEKEKLKHDNNIAWLSGKYIQLAVASVLSSDNKYLDLPIPIATSEKEKEEAKEKAQQKEQQQLRINLDNQMFKVQRLLQDKNKESTVDNETT